MSDYWRDELEPASLAGVPFQVESSGATPGRRTAIQEFPGTEFVRGQDLGPKAKRYSISGYLIGRDYHQQRARLEAVFDRPGPHLLVHPYRGRMHVLIDGDPDFQESKDKGGHCAVAFKAVRASTDDGRAIESLTDAATGAVDTARSTTASALASQVTGLDDPATKSSFLAKVADVQADISSAIGASLDPSDVSGAAVLAAIASMTSAVSAAIATPLNAFDAIMSTIELVIDSPMKGASSIESAYGELTNGQRIDRMLAIARRFASPESGLEPLTSGIMNAAPPTTIAAIQTRNAQTITIAVRVRAVASIVDTIASTKPDSTAQALAVRGAVENLLIGASDGDPDSLLYAADAETFAALSDLRATCARLLNDLALELPSVATYEVPSETNALVLAQKLLGDASRWGELAARNDLADPLFIPAGTIVEYLRVA